jgi:hypothetical protein
LKAFSVNGICNVLCLLIIDVQDNYLSAFRSEPSADRFTDAGTATSDYGNFSFEAL